jgi:hypothetical protein
MDGGKGTEGQEGMKEVAGVESACAELSAAVVNAADALYPPQVRLTREEGWPGVRWRGSSGRLTRLPVCCVCRWQRRWNRHSRRSCDVPSASRACQ